MVPPSGITLNGRRRSCLCGRNEVRRTTALALVLATGHVIRNTIDGERVSAGVNEIRGRFLRLRENDFLVVPCEVVCQAVVMTRTQRVRHVLWTADDDWNRGAYRRGV